MSITVKNGSAEIRISEISFSELATSSGFNSPLLSNMAVMPPFTRNIILSAITTTGPISEFIILVDDEKNNLNSRRRSVFLTLDCVCPCITNFLPPTFAAID